MALQSIRTYTQFKNTISKKDNKGEFVLKSDISSIRFIEYTPSFHRTIVNFIGQNDWDTFGLTDEPFDANLIMEFIKDTGYNVEQLVNEKKLYHNNNAHHDQIKNCTYVWFDCANDKWIITKNLNSFFTRKLYYIKKTLTKKITLKPDEKGLLNFSDEDNKNTVKTTLAKAKINTDSFDRIFNDYDDRLKDLGSNYFINDTNDFIHDFSEYLTFQSFCGNYISLQDYTHRDAPLFYKQLYLFQLIFTQIMLDHLDESPKIRKQIFDGIVKIRDYLSTNLTIRFDCLDRAYYLRETEFRRSFGPITYDESFRLDALEYLCAYNPTENPIQYIANSILPEGMKMTDEKFDSFLKHINYIYTALTNLSSDDSVTRLTLWTIPPNLDRRIGFIRDGVFCRPLFDVVEKYNSLQQNENAKIPITDLKPLPENCRIITYEEYHQLTSAQDSEHSTSDSSTPSSLKTESSSDEKDIIQVKRKCIKTSGITFTVFGVLALAQAFATKRQLY